MGFQIDKLGLREAKPKLSANKEQLLRSELVVYLTIWGGWGGKLLGDVARQKK